MNNQTSPAARALRRLVKNAVLYGESELVLIDEFLRVITMLCGHDKKLIRTLRGLLREMHHELDELDAIDRPRISPVIEALWSQMRELLNDRTGLDIGGNSGEHQPGPNEAKFRATPPARLRGKLPELDVEADDSNEAAKAATHKWFTDHGERGIDQFTVGIEPEKERKRSSDPEIYCSYDNESKYVVYIRSAEPERKNQWYVEIHAKVEGDYFNSYISNKLYDKTGAESLADMACKAILIGNPDPIFEKYFSYNGPVIEPTDRDLFDAIDGDLRAQVFKSAVQSYYVKVTNIMTGDVWESRSTFSNEGLAEDLARDVLQNTDRMDSDQRFAR